MKTAKSFLLVQLILLFFISHNANAQENFKAYDTLSDGKVVSRYFDKIALGDINGDKISDTAYVNKPNIPDDDSWDCQDRFCRVIVTFSCNVRPLYFESAVSADLENIGDIDGDGFSEIIAVPHWIIGCWGQYHFLTVKDGKWKTAARIKRNICREQSYRDSIRSIKKNKINAVEEVWEDGDVVEKPVVILIN